MINLYCYFSIYNINNFYYCSGELIVPSFVHILISSEREINNSISPITNFTTHKPKKTNGTKNKTSEKTK